VGDELKLPRLDSNQESQNQNPNAPRRNANSENSLRDVSPVGRSAGRSDYPGEGGTADADLAALVAAWPTLPEPIKRAVLALVNAAASQEKK
jgi:hypothetical protein